MSKGTLKVMLLSSMLVAGAVVLSGCNDKDYDFNGIDATMGLGGGELQLPVSSTEDIKLKDVLDLEEDGSLVEDPVTHDYVFCRNGDHINPVRISIDKIHVAKASSQSLPFSFDVQNSYSRSVRRTAPTVHADTDIYEFVYSGNKPAAVKELVSAEATTTLALSVPLTAISGVVGKLQTLELTFPSYLKYEVSESSAAYTSVDGSTIKFENVPTDRTFTVKLNVTGLDFSKAATSGSFSLTDKKVELQGKVHLAASGVVTGAAETVPALTAQLSMDDFTINAASGKFDPEINMTDGLGTARINGIPQFLKGDNVKADFSNPQVRLSIDNDMEAEGIITGKIISVKNGAVTNVIENVKVPVYPNANCVCISRTGEVYEDIKDFTMVTVPNLSTAIEKIPDEVTFAATAKANSDKVVNFRLGHEYLISTEYAIVAPLAFAENAVIVYTDTIADWNKDLKDLDLAENTYVLATATAQNGIPAYLSVDITPVGKLKADGTRDVVSGIKVEFPDGKNKAAASPDGVTRTDSEIQVKITQTETGALKKLDGLVLTATGKAKEDGSAAVTGITLNAEKHTLKLADINVKVVGKVIGDFN